MPLESLQQGSERKPNIRGLSVEAPEENSETSLKLWKKLKGSPAFDQEFKLWKKDRDPNFEDQTFDTKNQLIGIIIENLFNRTGAKEKFKNMKESKNYNDHLELWGESYIPGRDFNCIGLYLMDSQLLGIIGEAQFDENIARQDLEALQKQSLYDDKSGYWFAGAAYNLEDNTESELLNHYNSGDQLLGIIALSYINKQQAKKKFADLKKTDLYDSKFKQWNKSINQNLKWTGDGNIRYSDDQLLGIIAEILVNDDPQEALDIYRAIKETHLYNNETNKWRTGMSPVQELWIGGQPTSSALLEVWIENLLEKIPPQSLDAESTPPKTRDF